MAPGHDPDLQAPGRVMVAIGLDRLGRIGLDRDVLDRPPDDPAGEVAGLEHQLRCPAQGGEGIAAAERR